MCRNMNRRLSVTVSGVYGSRISATPFRTTPPDSCQTEQGTWQYRYVIHLFTGTHIIERLGIVAIAVSRRGRRAKYFESSGVSTACRV